jgi:hypothetical protein
MNNPRQAVKCEADEEWGSYTAEGDVLAISIPEPGRTSFGNSRERMPYGLYVPDVPESF